MSNKYIYDRFEPDRSIDILDEVCARVNLKETEESNLYNTLTKELNNIISLKEKAVCDNDFKKATSYKNQEFDLMNKVNTLSLNLTNKSNTVTLDDLYYVISLRTNLPLYEIKNSTVKVIENINKELNVIKGQDKAIKELLNVAKKIKLGFIDNKCYSMLFTGPSGVGKTNLAKIFGKCIAKDNVIKLDMSEYSDAMSINKIIGSPAGYVGYSDNKNILEEIKNKPFSVLILDEIEKADKSIINLLFQILDDGVIKDSKGNVVNFKNVTIIMTSNIGYNECSVGFNKNTNKLSKLKEYFDLPFINRIDNIINFDNLSYDVVKDITLSKINEVKEKYKNRINITLNDNVINEIINLSNYKEFGARKIEKLVKDKIEVIVIDEIVMENKSVTISELVNA